MKSFFKKIKIPFSKLIIALSLTIFLSGCAGHQLKESPREVNNEDLAAEAEKSNSPSKKPETNNNFSFTLEEALNQALKQNRSLADVYDQVKIAEFSLIASKAQFELKFFPKATIGLNETATSNEKVLGSGLELRKNLITGTDLSIAPSTQKNDDTYTTGMAFSITQPLLKGLSPDFNLANVKGAEFSLRSANRSLYISQVNTVLAVVSDIYNVIRQKEIVRLNEDSVKRLKGHVEAAKVKEKLGLVTPIDIYRATIELKQAQNNLAAVYESFQDAQDALKITLNLPLKAEVAVSAPLHYDLIKIEEQDAIDTALLSRIEIIHANDLIKERERLSAVAKHNTLPELNLSINYNRLGENSSFSQSTKLNEELWGISLNTSTDLRRTQEKAQYEQSLVAVKSSNRNLAQVQDNITRQAKQALRNLYTFEKQIEIQKEQIEQIKGKLKVAEVKFEHGLINNFDLIETEVQLRAAEINLLSAVINYIVGTYRLRASLGTLLEPYEEKTLNEF